MGASLLDQVLAETLDPAYAEAAEVRAAEVRAAEARAAEARAAEGAVPAAGVARRRSRRRGQLLTAAVLAVAGLLAGITYHQSAAAAPGRAQVREALVRDVRDQTAANDDLAAQLAGLRDEVDRARARQLQATAVGQDLLGRLDRAEQAAAVTAVHGPGLLVTLADAPPAADSDPVGGGTASSDHAGDVQDRDLQQVVNALWAAGAEAVSLNGRRLGPTSAIRFAGQAVLVDLHPVTSPYEISAVGDRDAMATAFLNSPEVGFLGVVSETTGLRFEYTREDDLRLPAGNVPELRSATRVPAAPDPTGASDPTDPTDPVPGG
jgi:uncharacterized protein YlxW (UPF0749 family)